MPFVHIGESTGAACPTPWAPRVWAIFSAMTLPSSGGCARHALGGRLARHIVSAPVCLALLLRRLCGYEEGLDYVGVYAAPGVDGDRREGRFGRAWRLAAARGADRPESINLSIRTSRRWRQFGASSPICRATMANCAGSTGQRKVKRRNASSTCCRRSARTVYNMKKIVEVMFDRDSFFGIKPRFGKPAIVWMARLNGQSVGVIASNPAVGGGGYRRMPAANV